MLIAIPYSLGFLLIGFASHISMLYIGRILDGAMIGFTAPSAQIFVLYLVYITLIIIISQFICPIDWRMQFTASQRSLGCIYRNLSLFGYFDHLHHWRFRALERFGLDLECFSNAAIRRHVLYARNTNLAFVKESRRRGQKVFTISSRSVNTNHIILHQR